MSKGKLSLRVFPISVIVNIILIVAEKHPTIGVAVFLRRKVNSLLAYLPYLVIR
jgi:hypothetical protein